MLYVFSVIDSLCDVSVVTIQLLSTYLLTYLLTYFVFCIPRDLDPKCIPVSESLQDTMERTLPLLVKRIIPDIKLGKTVLVVAHANSLRGMDVRLNYFTSM